MYGRIQGLILYIQIASSNLYYCPAFHVISEFGHCSYNLVAKWFLVYSVFAVFFMNCLFFHKMLAYIIFKGGSEAVVQWYLNKSIALSSSWDDHGNSVLLCRKLTSFILWKCSQFGDIYQEEYFMNIMKDEVNIVKELPSHLKSLDIEAIGSLVCDLLGFYVLNIKAVLFHSITLSPFILLLLDYWCGHCEGGNAHRLPYKNSSSPAAKWSCSLSWIR
jgi:hypothetical protein